jgi:hypothetical protein
MEIKSTIETGDMSLLLKFCIFFPFFQLIDKIVPLRNPQINGFIICYLI